MITANDIKNVRFGRKTMGGYNPGDVDRFLDDVHEAFKEFEAQNTKIRHEVEELNAKIEKFKDDEMSIRRAIINAQQIADASMIDAGVKSKFILKDASEKAAKIVELAKNDAQNKLSVSKKLYTAAKQFKDEIIKSYESQIVAIREINIENIMEIEKELFAIDETAKRFYESESTMSYISHFVDAPSSSKTLNECESVPL